MVKLNIILGLLLVGVLIISGCGGGLDNRSPVADAGGTLDAVVGVQTVLNGSGSDADGDPLEFTWSVLGNQENKVIIVELDNPTSQVTFLEQGTYELNLNVWDGEFDDDDVLIVSVSSQGGEGTCFDSEQNSDEEGTDCGGRCAITCTNENTPNTIFAAYVSSAPLIDGDVTEFSGGKSISLTNDRGVVGEYKFLWDENNLYVAGVVSDDEIYTSITQNDGNLWVDDTIEMSLDTNKDRSSSFDSNDYKFFLSPANIILDSRGYDSSFDSGLTHATNVYGTLNEQSQDDLYYLELAIPWSSIGVSASKDKELGFALSLNDRVEDGSHTQKAWYGSINSPSTFGTLILANGFVNNLPVCGNNELEEGEECDDGNNQDGDGCSWDCKEENTDPSDWTKLASAKVMPLGDSITRGHGGEGYVQGVSDGDIGYRKKLYLDLTNDDCDVDFVGSLSPNHVSGFDKDHEGHGYWWAKDPPQYAIDSGADSILYHIYDWLNQNPADIILLHIGANDISGGDSGELVLADIEEILDEIDRWEEDKSKDVFVVLAKITDTASGNSRIRNALNPGIQTLVQERILQGDLISLVDMQNALNYPADLRDGVHPNEVGYEKMADVWLPAVKDLIICENNNYEGDMLAKPLPGNYKEVTHVWLESNIPGADIYYTTDGSTPTTNSEEYFEAIEIRDTTNIKAIAVLPGTNNKEEFSGTYSIQKSPQIFELNDETYIEAEATLDYTGFIARPDSRASNGEYMLMLDDGGEELNFHIKPKTSGNYDVWLRNDNVGRWASITVQMDNGEKTKVYVNPNNLKLNGWDLKWTKVGSYDLTANNDHVFSVLPRQRQGRIDKLYFSKNGGVPSEIDLIQPAGGEVWLQGDSKKIRWESEGNTADIKIEYSSDYGKTWNVVVSQTPNDDEYLWENVPQRGDYKIKITDLGLSKSVDETTGTFFVSAVQNPFTTQNTFAKKINGDAGMKHYQVLDNFPSYDAYLDFLVEQGANNYEYVFRGRMGECVSYRDEFNKKECGPYNDSIDAYYSQNTINTPVGLYGNLFSVHSGELGEGFMGRTKDYPEYFLYDENGDVVINPINDRPNYNFAHPGLQDKFVSWITRYYDAGEFIGVEYDSFSVLKKKNFENGEWKDTNGDNILIMDPRTNQPYLTKDFITDQRKAVYKIDKLTDRHAQKKNAVVFNINGLKHLQLEEYGDLIDSYMREGFAGPADSRELWNTSGWYQLNSWEGDVNGLFEAEQADKVSILGSGKVYGNPAYHTDSSAANYYLTSMMMGISGPDTKAYIRSRGYSEVNWPGFSKIKLKWFVPLSRYERVGNIYKREFSEAIVYVNPTKNQETVSFGGSYYYMQESGEWSSNRISSMNLKPLQGVILVKFNPNS